MSLLTRFLSESLRVQLSKRMTSSGVCLDDVIRSGLLNPDSSVGVYAPDHESYEVFRELFDPILQDFQASPCAQPGESGRLNPSTIVSTRVRYARNLAGHPFPAWMSKSERLGVEEQIERACRLLPSDFQGELTRLQAMPDHRIESMVSRGHAFGADDKYLAAAGVYEDWPIGRSVFNSHNGKLSIWINEEDHLRVAIIMPGACLSECHQMLCSVMSQLALNLEFCVDDRLGCVTSCPSNVGTAFRASFLVDMGSVASQTPPLEQLAAAGVIQIRGSDGEHSARSRGLADVSFRNRIGISELKMLRRMEMLCAIA